jgi:glycosyltransferase involved in cell wall biosynthesis
VKRTTPPAPTTDPDLVTAALAGRLRTVADVLVPDAPAATGRHAADVGTLHATLVEAAAAADGTSTTWLLLVGLTGSFPTDSQVRSARRRVTTAAPAEAAAWLLERTLGAARWSDLLVQLEVLTDAVVVDVDFSARHDLNTGIQRVVRSTLPRWHRDHDVTPVAWTPTLAMRRLDAVETGRVLAWRGPAGEPPRVRSSRRVLVPWRSTVVLPEVPAPHLCSTLASLAEHSGNTVGVVGYDCIPVVSADLMPPIEPERFARYLTIIKHAHRVSGISASAAEEFRGFVDMLPAQGLGGPAVTDCPLPVDIPSSLATPAPVRDGDPLVVVVGSHEPRKNHLAVLHAAELLWREGLRFELRFIGGSSWASAPFDAAVRRLRRTGRRVAVGRAVRDEDLWNAYRTARFTVFPSLHEGFGLPVAESLAVGTPAITSSFGSTAEVAADGGTLLVDPRDDADLTAAMRRLLTDADLVQDLAAAAAARPRRTWDDYARESWAQLVPATARPEEARR